MDGPGPQESSTIGTPAPSISLQEASKSKMPMGLTPGLSEIGGDIRVLPVEPRVRYRECRKNFAACSGGYVVDGCGEFIPSGEKDGYKCAACQCHRNFHRKEVEGEPGFSLATHSRKWPHSAGTLNLADTDNSDHEEEKHGRIETEHFIRKQCGK